MITKKLNSAVVSLDEGGAMPDATYGDIHQGITKYSNEDFKAVLKYLLTQEIIDHFSLCFSLQPSFMVPNLMSHHLQNQVYSMLF